MATNSLFDFTEQLEEQELASDLISESIQNVGFNILYLPRTHTQLNPVLGEDTASEFLQSYEVEMYLETVEGFSPDYLSRFGIEIHDEARFTISRRTWPDRVGGTLERPREGDLLYWPLTKSVFQITFVQDQRPFFQMGALYTWTITVATFRYSNEKFRTGIPEVDNIENKYASGATINLSGVTGDFLENEVVYQGDLLTKTFFAEVVSFASDVLTVKHFGGTIQAATITGEDSGATGTVTTSSLASFGDPQNEQYKDNKAIQDASDVIVDWDPHNPFGSG